MIRLVSTGCLLALLGLVGGGSLFAGPLGMELLGGESGSDAGRLAFGQGAALQVQVATVGPTAGPTTGPVPANRSASPTVTPSPSPRPEQVAVAPSFPAWVTNAREASLWSAPGEGTLFSTLPPGATFRVLDRQQGRYRVFYPGDRARRLPGEAWMDVGDVVGMDWPRWVRLREPSSLFTAASAAGPAAAGLRAGAFVEVVGETQGHWARVHFAGDGRSPAVQGWLAAGPVAPLPGPVAEQVPSFALTRDLLTAGGPETWLKVPYRSQLDGMPYAEANCGPTVVNMVLESFGVRVPQPDLRREVLSLQPNEACDDCGVYIQHLAEVITRRGLKVGSLRDDNPEEFHRWSLDQIRAELRAGRPVIPQVFYRGLPGRASSPYWGDHFIVLTGLHGDRFVFNDPIDADGPGYGRLITARALELAMAGSDYPYAAFSVGR